MSKYGGRHVLAWENKQERYLKKRDFYLRLVKSIIDLRGDSELG